MISLKETLNQIGVKISAITSSLSNVPHRTLLWTNSSPSNNFGSQTVSLGLSNYDEVEIFYRIKKSWSELSYIKIMKGTQTLIHSISARDNLAYGSVYVSVRTASVNASGVVFGNATGCFADGSYALGGSTDNSWCIPYKIYGIKYGGV